MVQFVTFLNLDVGTDSLEDLFPGTISQFRVHSGTEVRKRTYIPAELFVKPVGKIAENQCAAPHDARNYDGVDVHEMVDARCVGVRAVERVGELSRQN